MNNRCRINAANLTTALGLLVVHLCATGCKPASPSQVPEPTAEEKAHRFLASRQVVNDNTGFAVDLYHQVRTRKGNLFLSPFSISTALAMTYAGARGNTEREMAKALHFTLPQADLHAVFAHLQVALEKAQREDEVQLAVANSLWPRQGLSLRPTFIQLMERDYRTTLTPLDFGQPEPARQTINRWVEEKTRDRIKELIAPRVLSPDTVLVLANAIYFKGRWLEPFDPKQTRSAPFHLSATRTVNAPTMHQTARFGYTSVEEVDLLELRYRGEKVSMVVIVPKAVDGLAAVEAELTAAKLVAWIARISDPGRVIVALPKFETTTALSVREPLIALGMRDAFHHADFSGMFESAGPYISEAVHQAFVSVDEAGTEAAAATAVIIQSSMPPTVQVNRPFLFLIRDRTTGSILFLGRIMDPTAA
jgi:serpin B